jgi:hypothetical protein
VSLAGRAEAWVGRYSPEGLKGWLGGYEQIALDAALELEHAIIDPAPEGKTVRSIRVVNLPVFVEEDGFLEFFNVFHATTQPHIIEREVLVRPGEVWDQARIHETERNLLVPEYSQLVVIVPVKTGGPDSVDILVVTRDVWSLRPNSRITLNNLTLVRVEMAAAENNFLGLRKQVGIRFLLDLGSVAVGPSYVDPNILGSRLRFEGYFQSIFNRDSFDFEGTRSDLKLSYPLWSLSRRWAALVAFKHDHSIQRSFRGAGVLLFPDPERPDAIPGEETAPREFRLKSSEFRLEGTRAIGSIFSNRFTFGMFASSRRPSLLPDFSGSPALALRFEEEVLGRSERLVGPVLRYEGFLTNFMLFRDVTTLDFVEAVRIGPELTVELLPALEWLGSELDLLRARATVGWTLDLDQGYAKTAVTTNIRWSGDQVTGSDLEISLFAALPPVGRLGRLVAGARYNRLIVNGDDQILSAGGETGLRGYRTGEFVGETRALWNVEWRTPSVAVKFLRLGGVLFWDMGHAADTFTDLEFHHDVGIGLRRVIPQDTRFINRIDWAIPLTGDKAGFPGRVTASFGQFF